MQAAFNTDSNEPIVMEQDPQVTSTAQYTPVKPQKRKAMASKSSDKKKKDDFSEVLDLIRKQPENHLTPIASMVNDLYVNFGKAGQHEEARQFKNKILSDIMEFEEKLKIDVDK